MSRLMWPYGDSNGLAKKQEFLPKSVEESSMKNRQLFAKEKQQQR